MTRDFHRNTFILCAAICFTTTGFIGGSAAAQTKKGAARTTKAAPTAKKSKISGKISDRENDCRDSGDKENGCKYKRRKLPKNRKTAASISASDKK